MLSRFASILSIVVLTVVLTACTPASSGGPASSAPTGATTVQGRVHAGPTCPVVRPNEPACADRPVAGAVLVVTSATGAQIARATSAVDGTFSVALLAGDYVLVPQPVTGLMGTAQPVPFRVLAGGAAAAPLDVAYDTGIR